MAHAAQVHRTIQSPLEEERSRVQSFLEDYDRAIFDLGKEKEENASLRTENANLLSEINMLREALEISDNKRIKTERMTGALVARLGTIKDVIDTAAREAIKQGSDVPKEVPKAVSQQHHQVQAAVTQVQTTQAHFDEAALRDIVHRLPRVNPI